MTTETTPEKARELAEREMRKALNLLKAVLAAADTADALGNAESAIERSLSALLSLSDQVERLTGAMTKISDIRDSIIGFHKINWSEHIYPLVAALDGAGYPGAEYEIARENAGTLVDQIKTAEAEVTALTKERDALRDALTAMLGRYELYCGDGGMPAGQHDKVAMTLARAALNKEAK